MWWAQDRDARAWGRGHAMSGLVGTVERRAGLCNNNGATGWRWQGPPKDHGSSAAPRKVCCPAAADRSTEAHADVRAAVQDTPWPPLHAAQSCSTALRRKKQRGAVQWREGDSMGVGVEKAAQWNPREQWTLKAPGGAVAGNGSRIGAQERAVGRWQRRAAVTKAPRGHRDGQWLQASLKNPQQVQVREQGCEKRQGEKRNPREIAPVLDVLCSQAEGGQQHSGVGRQCVLPVARGHACKHSQIGLVCRVGRGRNWWCGRQRVKGNEMKSKGMVRYWG